MIPGRHRRLSAPDGAAVVPVLRTAGRAAHRPPGRPHLSTSAPVGGTGVVRWRRGERAVAGSTSYQAVHRLPPLARGPVFAAMAALALVLTLSSGGYGYHRDELYFRLLPPAWGYLDQPPLRR